MSVAEVRKRLIDGTANFAEITQLIKSEGRFTRGVALIALSRWIRAHEDFQPNKDLIGDLVNAALDTHPHADQYLPGADFTSRYLAIGCLADIGTPEALNTLDETIRVLNLDERTQRDLKSFLRERPDHHLW